MKKSLKIKSVMLIAEEEKNLDDISERVLEASKLPTQIFIDKPIKINDAVILGFDGNKTFLQGIIRDNEGEFLEVSYITAKDLEKAESDETLSTKKPKSRPSTKEEIELILNYLKSKEKFPDMLPDMTEEEYGDFTTYELAENNLLVIVNCVFIHYFKKESPKVLAIQERYSIKYGIVYPIEDDIEIDDLDEDISEITSIL